MARNLRYLLSLPVFQEEAFANKQQKNPTQKWKSKPVVTYRNTRSLGRVQGKEESKPREL